MTTLDSITLRPDDFADYEGWLGTRDVSAIVNVQRRAESWLANGRAFTDYSQAYIDPDQTTMPETRKGSRLTAPNATDTQVKLAQFVRVSGLRGVVALSKRTVTASGKGTRNVPVHAAGLPPMERVPLVMLSEDEALPESEMRFLRRYRDAMKGDKFAASMKREEEARSRGWWRAARPYWPLDKAGRFESGRERMNPRTGRMTLRFLDGSYLDERIAAHKAMDADKSEQIEAKRERMQRDAELAALVAAQDSERKADKRGRIKIA